MTKMKEAVKHVLDTTTFPTERSLISFNTTATLNVDWTWSSGSIWTALNTLTPSGMTNYAPAITMSKAQMDKKSAIPDECKFVILLGDGAQNINDPTLDTNLLKSQ